MSHPHTHGAPRLLEAIDKGLGPLPAGALPAGDVSHLNWNLLREDVSLPAAVLYADRLAHNLHWMQQFVTAYGVRLAPHGKTTMAPRLFRMQLAAGAWGITLATAAQVQAAYHGGVRRVLMANQLVGRQNMALIADLLANHGFEFFCLVDSVANVERLGAFFRAAGQPLNVLLEVGLPGGRTGVRDLAQRDAVLAALARWPDALKLAGLELYEAVVDDEAGVRAALRQAVAWTGELIRGGHFARQPALLSGAGSSWYDVVAEEFKHAHAHGAVDIVLRPGCYLTHDAGIYHQAQHQVEQRCAVARRLGAGLKPALQVWAYVQSRPQADCAIVGLGRRDAGSASGLPAPALHYRPDPAAHAQQHGMPLAVPAGWQVTKMMDQHAYLKVGEHDDLEVGDMIAFDVSHPCLTFDKWRHLLVVDSAFHVTEVIDTCF